MAGVIPEEKQDLLTRPVLAHTATVDSNGNVQNNPVWIDWDGEFLRFSQVPGRQKYANLNAHGGVAFSLVDPENPYRYLEIRGRLERVEQDPDKAFINKMAKKYMGVDVYPWSTPEEQRVIMVIRPVKVTQMG